MSATIKPFKDWTKKAALRLIRGAPVKPIERWDIKAGDLVHIRSGRSAGAQGRVKEVLRDKNRVLVENANMVKRHVRATATAPGGVLAKESPVHYSNVALVDPQTGKPTRVTRVRGPDGLQRISKRSGVVIPVNAETLKARRAERPPEPGPKDTPASAVARVTYAPDAALLPYLAAGGSLWEIAGSRGAARPALPKLLRGDLKRRTRRKIRERFETELERARLEREVEAATRSLQREARAARKLEAGAEGAGAAAAAAAAAASAGVGGAQQAQTAELR